MLVALVRCVPDTRSLDLVRFLSFALRKMRAKKKKRSSSTPVNPSSQTIYIYVHAFIPYFLNPGLLKREFRTPITLFFSSSPPSFFHFLNTLVSRTKLKKNRLWNITMTGCNCSLRKGRPSHTHMVIGAEKLIMFIIFEQKFFK